MKMNINNNRMRKIQYISLIVFSIIAYSSCKHEPDLESLPNLTYEKDIKIIISSNCASKNGCHGTDPETEFPLTTYEQVMEECEVKPGDAHGSKLYEVITDNGEEKMPPEQDLDDKDIKRIYIWILKGAVKE